MLGTNVQSVSEIFEIFISFGSINLTEVAHKNIAILGEIHLVTPACVNQPTCS